MLMRPLGQSGIQASAVALGTWVMGGWMWGGADEAACVRAIHAALDAGVNLLDTAPIYGFGQSELVVGKALKELGPAGRDRAVIATKCGMVPTPGSGRGRVMMRSTALGPAEDGHIEVSVYNGPESIVAECERSLRRLGVSHIDLYQTHWQEETTPYEETMGALLKLKQQGKVRAIGVCNATPAIMDRYRTVAPLDSDQEKFSMLDRKLEAEQLPYCREQNIAVLAYSPLALGLLTGKVGPDAVFPVGDLRRTHKRYARENLTKVNALLDRVRPIAAAKACTLGQLVIAWTVRQPGVTHALVGARDEKQARENAAAGSVELTDNEQSAINSAVRDLGAGIA
ncbi:MAG TPA: aldo/keto reductase [Phycisphaerales bacterium]|nr:aldo/keto reductase [Phycisphaerales bacterium]